MSEQVVDRVPDGMLVEHEGERGVTVPDIKHAMTSDVVGRLRECAELVKLVALGDATAAVDLCQRVEDGAKVIELQSKAIGEVCRMLREAIQLIGRA